MTFPILTNDGRVEHELAAAAEFPAVPAERPVCPRQCQRRGREETMQPGSVKTLRPDAAVKQIQVIRPRQDSKASSKCRKTAARAPISSFGDTDQVGVYQVAWDDKVQRISRSTCWTRTRATSSRGR